jgi:hypothetical protein
MSTQAPVTSNFQPWYTQRRPDCSFLPPEQIGATVRAVRLDDTNAPVRIAERHQSLAQQSQSQWRAIRFWQL